MEKEDHTELLRAIETGQSSQKLAQLVRSWTDEPLRLRLSRAAEQVQSLAERLSKAPVDIQVEGDPIRQPQAEWQELWAQLAHVFRNAVDHGLETKEERLASGKPEIATIKLSGHVDGSKLVVCVEDSGRGIDWKAVERKGLAMGILKEPTSDPEKLSPILFVDGLTTKDEVSDISGRGVGLASLQQAVVARGGNIRIESKSGQGSKFIISWPWTANDNDRAASKKRTA